MKQKSVTVTSASGLHARPAGLLCGLAQSLVLKSILKKMERASMEKVLWES